MARNEVEHQFLPAVDQQVEPLAHDTPSTVESVSENNSPLKSWRIGRLDVSLQTGLARQFKSSAPLLPTESAKPLSSRKVAFSYRAASRSATCLRSVSSWCLVLEEL